MSVDPREQWHPGLGDGMPDPKSKWWERIKPIPEHLLPAFEEAMAYGRYWRKTGKEAPPEWKPGDPIPEPEFDE